MKAAKGRPSRAKKGALRCIALRSIGRDWPEPEKSPGAAAAPPETVADH